MSGGRVAGREGLIVAEDLGTGVRAGGSSRRSTRWVWLGQQLGSGVGLLLAFATLVFVAVNVAIPFDYATQFRLGGAELADGVREQLGLDRPLGVRWLAFMGGLVTGDLGTSYGGEPVASLLWRRFPVTLLIFVVGGIIAYMLGGWLGRLSGWRPRRGVAGSTTSAGVVLYTLFPPFLVFVLAYFLADPAARLRVGAGLPINSLQIWHPSGWDPHTVLLLVSCSLLVAVVATATIAGTARRRGVRWLPAPVLLVVTVGVAVAGWYAAGFGVEGVDLLLGATGSGRTGWGSPAMAVLAFVLLAFGEVMLLTRVGMESERGEQYIQTAAAKGLAPRLIRDRHVARVASVPALTRAVTSLPYLLTGMIIIELELQIGGLSSLLFGAITSADVPVIVGTLVAVGALTVLARIVMDLVHALIDPRVGQGAP